MYFISIGFCLKDGTCAIFYNMSYWSHDSQHFPLNHSSIKGFLQTFHLSLYMYIDGYKYLRQRKISHNQQHLNTKSSILLYYNHLFSTFSSKVSIHQNGFSVTWYQKGNPGCNTRIFKSLACVPKGCLAVYVGEKMKRFVIPVSYLNRLNTMKMKLN